MIFTSLPGYRVVTYRLGEDGSDHPPAFLVFEEHAVLAWRTTERGLVPVATNEIAVSNGDDLREGEYAVVMPDGSVLHGEHASENVVEFKATVTAAFNEATWCPNAARLTRSRATLRPCPAV